MKVELINYMGNDLTVVNAARVSYNVNKKTFIDTDAKLIKYLAKHKHMSPFGHCFASFKVQAPQTKDKKQGSGDIIQDEEIQSKATFYLSDVIGEAMDAYSKLLKMGVCEEQARMVLPLCHMTEWFWSGSLDAFADMCILRCAGDAQVETKMVADQISDHMEKLFPVSWKELMNETNS